MKLKRLLLFSAITFAAFIVCGRSKSRWHGRSFRPNHNSPGSFHGRSSLGEAHQSAANETVNYNRIAGGAYVEAGQFTSYARVYSTKGRYLSICGGTIISEYHILTAAHCIRQGWRMFVKFGHLFNMEARDHMQVSKVCLHWDHEGNHDIAVLKLTSPVNLDGRTKSVAVLPEEAITSNEQMYIVGTGLTGEGTLPRKNTAQHLKILMVKQNSCPFNSEVDHVVCYSANSNMTGRTCEGDSGGPVYAVRNNKLTVVAVHNRGPKVCAKESFDARDRSLGQDVFALKRDVLSMMELCS